MATEVEFSPDIDWALSILERSKPEAARIIRLRLLERPNLGWVEDLKEAAELLEQLTVIKGKERRQELANRLKSYACSIIGSNSFLDLR